MAQEQTDDSVDSRKVKNWRKAKTPNITELLLGIGEEVRGQLLDLVLAVYREMKAIARACS